MARKRGANLPPDVQAEIKRRVNLEMDRRAALKQMTDWTNEAKRLHDAGDLEGARAALKKAETWRGKMEAIQARQGKS